VSMLKNSSTLQCLGVASFRSLHAFNDCRELPFQEGNDLRGISRIVAWQVIAEGLEVRRHAVIDTVVIEEHIAAEEPLPTLASGKSAGTASHRGRGA